MTLENQAIELSFPSDLAEIEGAAASLRDFCEAHAFEDTVSVELCIVEALTNVVEHAYAGKAGFPVTLRAFFEPRGLVLEVCDQGESIPAHRFEDAENTLNFDPEDTMALPEGGFGLLIIQKCATRFAYHPCGERNLLRMEFSKPEFRSNPV